MNDVHANIPRFKIAIIGIGGVGKTSYVKRLLSGEFQDKHQGRYIDLFCKLCIEDNHL